MQKEENLKKVLQEERFPFDPNDRLIKLAAVCEITSLGKNTVYKLMRAGQFPLAVNITSKAVAWKYQEVMEFIENLDRIVIGEARKKQRASQ